MNLNEYIKKLNLPEGFSPPERLVYENLAAAPLTREDLKADLEAVNSSRELILKTRGGLWPEKEIDEDNDFLDLAWHEREFRDNNSFAYTVYDKGDRYIGCFYIYPMGYRTKLNEELKSFDVDVSWWVTSESYGKEEYSRLFQAIKKWLVSDFPFESPYFSNKEIPDENN